MNENDENKPAGLVRSSDWLAASVARLAHGGAFRNDGVTPYITHPEAVAATLEAWGCDEETIQAGWLHDVIEDTAYQAQTLVNEGIAGEVVDVVLCLTKQKGEDYAAYLERVKSNPRAVKVKIADMLHNLSDSPSRNQVQRYANGLRVLMAANEKLNDGAKPGKVGHE